MTRMDDDIARLYAGTDIKPTYVMALLRLHHRGPMTIRELADKLAAEEALARRSFHDRIAARLAEDPAWR